MDNNSEKRINPFFAPYNTPHETFPFNNLKNEDFEEAFMEGIRREKESTDIIINDPETPTFDNTIARVYKDKDKHYYDLLDRVSNVFFNLLSAETNDDLDALAQKMSPILTQHANDIRLNEKLFNKVKYVFEHHRELTPEEDMLLKTNYDSFVRSGATLDEEGKEKLRKLTEEADLLGLQFSQNLLNQSAYHRRERP